MFFLSATAPWPIRKKYEWERGSRISQKVVAWSCPAKNGQIKNNLRNQSVAIRIPDWIGTTGGKLGKREEEEEMDLFTRTHKRTAGRRCEEGGGDGGTATEGMEGN